ncbi:hypothetical protein C1D58_001740 [Salmonella enterica subsp. enterica serovar Waral]|nr:hypothetical protein [Salmonella enterica subsp. enterica serovar Typhimurium]EEJ3913626.1 hypothetical protein [Salmonella enterica subsp. enterica serovar Waral]
MRFWCSFTVTRQQSLTAMQAAARKEKGAEGVSRYNYASRYPAGKNSRQRTGAVKGGIVRQY